MSVSKVSDRQLRHVELLDGENIAGAWIAGLAHGETSNTTKVGGTLVVTDRRVIFRPVKLPVGVVSWRDQRWIDGYGFALGLGEVVRVEVDSNRRAALVVRSAEGMMAINVGHSRFTPMWSKKNEAARDDAVARINEAIAAA